ncbi:coiled-coil domain-containing protein 124 [Culicoides brevitarsis]|uniref:coiled-coil domain-containing protein 124 n=1 Tax=Culicoides brevitarsis TaxID=469753 RepID=UPI00307C9BCE
MPKKMGINTKAVEAKERKAATKKAENDKKEKAKEDAYWADDDAKLAKKKKQREEEEKKRLEQQRKKQEAKELLEKEMSSIQTTAKLPQSKITRAQVEAELEKRNKAVENLNKEQKPKFVKPLPIEENLSELNRAMFETHIATNIDEALAVLSSGDTGDDKHPEKRMKAAYKAYEDAQLTRMKADNPSLKLSQLKQIIFKNWQKSPENPMNQLK